MPSSACVEHLGVRVEGCQLSAMGVYRRARPKHALAVAAHYPLFLFKTYLFMRERVHKQGEGQTEREGKQTPH